MKALLAKILPWLLTALLIWWAVTDPQNFANTVSTILIKILHVGGGWLKALGHWLAENLPKGDA